VKVLEKVQRDDPGLYAKHKSAFQLRRAESLISAAEGIGSSDRFGALGLVVRGVWSRLLFPKALRAFAHIIAPGFAIKAIRQVKRYRIAQRAAAAQSSPTQWR
jgi:hypothetical protein